MLLRWAAEFDLDTPFGFASFCTGPAGLPCGFGEAFAAFRAVWASKPLEDIPGGVVTEYDAPECSGAACAAVMGLLGRLWLEAARSMEVLRRERPVRRGKLEI